MVLFSNLTRHFCYVFLVIVVSPAYDKYFTKCDDQLYDVRANIAAALFKLEKVIVYLNMSPLSINHQHLRLRTHSYFYITAKITALLVFFA